MVTFDDVELARQHLMEMTRQYWLNHVVFTGQWWFLVACSVVPWIVWGFLADRKRMVELLAFGFLIAVLCSILDTIGMNLMLWTYPYMSMWFLIPSLMPIDLSVLPVEHMLLYQYFRRWPTYVLALIGAAIIVSFVVEPLFVRAGLYRLYDWRYIYSLPLYVLKAMLARWFIERCLRTQSSATRV